MKYDFPIDTYDTEVVKVLSVWSELSDEDLPSGRSPTIRADAAFTSTWCTSARKERLYI